MASSSEKVSTATSKRAKTDIAWDHINVEYDPVTGKKLKLRCIYCQKTTTGAGINRMKKHLAGIKGDITACLKVPHDIRYQMVRNLSDIDDRKGYVNATQGPRIRDDESQYEYHGSGGNEN
jgi:hypothetical protein